MLRLEHFDDFFGDIHGHPPFDWQRRLARAMVDGRPPDVIDVPTGLGKTAVVDAAVFALAARVSVGLPSDWVRLFFVIDRRLVVDATFQRAELVANRLAVATSGVVGEVAAALRHLSGADAPPLVACRMRGGTSWDWNWVPSVVQPAVVVSTVDQFGSRLLFRGYGLSPRLHPIDAALCGTDALVIVDEAHLSTALLQTIQQATQLERTRAPQSSVRSIAMSATVGAPEGGDVLGIDPVGESSSPVAHRRLETSRQVQLVELAGTPRGPTTSASVLAAAAIELLAGEAEVVGVIVNTVATARSAFEELRARDDDLQVDLLIGRTREFERGRVARRLDDVMTGQRRRGVGTRRVIVATQTIEVGADLDLDALVTEAAPLDSLLQRLGRVDRDGLLGWSTSIVIAERSRRLAGLDPVYGGATWRTWDALSSVRQPLELTYAAALDAPLAALEAETLDLGYRGRLDLAAQLPPMDLLVPPPALHPVVLASDLDTWSQTEPAPVPDQPVDSYLHGLEVARPSVTVCWRVSPSDPSREPPPPLPVRSHEQVELPIAELRRFLAGVARGEIGDTGSSPTPESDETEVSSVFAWRVRADGFDPIRNSSQVRPGDNIVISAERGGLDRWGWAPLSEAAVADVWDLGTGDVLRLDTAVLASQLGVSRDDPRLAPLSQMFASLREHVDADAATDEGDLDLAEILVAITDVVAQFDHELADDLAQRCARIRAAPRLREQNGVLVLTAHGRPVTSTDESDDGTSRAAAPMSLRSHLIDVADEAFGVATRAGLDRRLADAVRLGALAHDLGKADQRFQTMLRNGDRLAAELAEVPLAKSAPPGAAVARRGDRTWPRGYRHEDVSAALIAELERVDPAWFGDTDRELVIHLAQTHHGWGRPLPRAVLDDVPVEVRVEVPDGPTVVATPSGRVDLRAAERFDRLRRRYGWWGLARLEAIVRLADIARSRNPRRLDEIEVSS